MRNTKNLSPKSKNNKDKKKELSPPKKLDYIIRSDKPLIFRKKKIKKIGDLIGKGNFNKKRRG